MEQVDLLCPGLSQKAQRRSCGLFLLNNFFIRDILKNLYDMKLLYYTPFLDCMHEEKSLVIHFLSGRLINF